MSSTTVTAEPSAALDTRRRDVRGIPLERLSVSREGDPFIGTCPDWCDGRHVWEMHDDRSHFGESVDMALELEDGTYDEATATHYATTIRSYLQQHYRESEPRVFLGRGEMTGLHLTLAEASMLRDRLVELLEEAGR